MKSTPLRKNIRSKINEIQGSISSASDETRDKLFARHLEILKAILESLVDKKIGEFEDIEPICEICVLLLEQESHLRDKTQSNTTAYQYDNSRWELVLIILRIYEQVSKDYYKRTHDLIERMLSNPQGILAGTFCRSKMSKADISFDKKFRSLFRLYAMQTIDYFSKESSFNPLSLDVIDEALKILKISSFEDDLGDPFRETLFDFMCKFDAQEEEENIWRSDPTKYFTHHSNIYLTNEQSFDKVTLKVLNHICWKHDNYDSFRNRFMKFYQWSLVYGCSDAQKASDNSINTLISLITDKRTSSKPAARRVAMALELLSFMEFEATEEPELSFNVPESFHRIQLITLLKHTSDFVRSRAIQFFGNWIHVPMIVDFEKDHLFIQEALLEILIDEKSPIVRLQAINLLHVLLIYCEKSFSYKEKAFTPEANYSIARECLKTFKLVPNSPAPIRLLISLYINFQYKLANVTAELLAQFFDILECSLESSIKNNKVAKLCLTWLLQVLTYVGGGHLDGSTLSRVKKFSKEIGDHHEDLTDLKIKVDSKSSKMIAENDELTKYCFWQL